MKKFKIRKALRKDIDDILIFINKLAEFEQLKDSVKTNVRELETNIFDNRYAEVIVLEEDDIAIGFALYYFTFSTFEGKPTLYLEDLFVLESKRKMGYGKKTLIYLANEAINNGCARFEWSCLNWNEKAIKFYDKFGALPQDEWTIFRLEGKKLIGYKI